MSLTSKLENPHIGSSPPSDLYLGRTWIETTANGLETWIWNGIYWLSLEVYRYSFTTSTIATSVLTTSFPVDLGYNLYLLNLFAGLTTTNNTAANLNWIWTLARVNSAGVATNLATANNIGQTANTWQSFKTVINQHINVSATGATALRITESRTGNSNKAGTIGFEYKRARL